MSDILLKSIDEETSDIVDMFDAEIAPKRVHRSLTNKLYLILKSIAAAFVNIRELILGSKYRFNPRYCDDDDLLSTMFITGEKSIPAKSSLLRISVYNTDSELSVTLRAGDYVYTSVDSQQFLCTVPSNVVLNPLEFVILVFSSKDVGAWKVANITSVSVLRVDAAPIDTLLRFEAFDNSSSLGQAEESMFNLRQRLLTDTSRQDSIKELQTAIRSLPSIYACDLIFNESRVESVILDDGTTLDPKKLLVVITGVPNADLVETIVSRTIYDTQMVESNNVLWYENDLFVGGRHPVYYTYHTDCEYYITIYYSYSPMLRTKDEVEQAYRDMFSQQMSATQRIQEVTEAMMYEVTSANPISGVFLKKIYLQTALDGELKSVISLPVPKLSIQKLKGITFIGEEV